MDCSLDKSEFNIHHALCNRLYSVMSWNPIQLYSMILWCLRKSFHRWVSRCEIFLQKKTIPASVWIFKKRVGPRTAEDLEKGNIAIGFCACFRKKSGLGMQIWSGGQGIIHTFGQHQRRQGWLQFPLEDPSPVPQLAWEVLLQWDLLIFSKIKFLLKAL